MVNIRVNVVFHRIICKLLKIKTRVNVVNVMHVGKSSLGSIVNFVYLVEHRGLGTEVFGVARTRVANAVGMRHCLLKLGNMKLETASKVNVVNVVNIVNDMNVMNVDEHVEKCDVHYLFL